MKNIECKCSNCGATLKVAEDREKLYCEYCGNLIMLKDENTIRIVDEAEIIRAQTEKEEKEREAEDRKRADKESNNIGIGIFSIMIFYLLFTHFMPGNSLDIIYAMICTALVLIIKKKLFDDPS